MLSSEGWSQFQIAQALRIHETTVTSHLKDYLDSNKLRNKSGGSISKLTVEQSKEVGAYLEIKEPFNRKYLEDKYQLKLSANKKILTKKQIIQLKQVLSNEPDYFTNKEILKDKKTTTQMLLDALRKPQPHKNFILHMLPPYNPNLNPIERVWKVMNEHVRNNKVFSSFKKFKTAILDFFAKEWNGIACVLKMRINDHFEKLNPVF